MSTVATIDDTTAGSETTEPAADRRGAAWGHGVALVLALLVALAAHAWMALGADGPVWMDDEVGYLVNGAFLAGEGPAQLASLGYWAGWSLSIVPLYWLGLAPAEIYAGAVGLSALYGALVVLPAHSLARSLGGSRTVAVVAALVIATLPDRTVLSNYAMAENALVLTSMVAAACMARAVTSDRRLRSRVWFVAGAVASVLAFLVHARAVTLVGAAALVGAGLLLRRSERIAGAAVLAVTLVGGAAVYAVNSWVVSTVYAGAAGAREGGLLSGLAGLDPWSLLLPGSGQAWYQVAAFGGLSLAGGAVVLVGAVSGLRRFDDAFLRDLYLLIAGFTSALLSITAVTGPISRGTTRIDFYFYGRYLTHVAAVLAVVGLVWLLTRARWRHVAALTALGAALTAVFLTRGARYGDADRVFPPMNVPGVTPFPWPSLTDVTERPDLWPSLIGLAVPIVVMLLRRPAWLVAVVLVPASLAATVNAGWVTVDPFDAPIRGNAIPLRHPLALIDEDRLVVTSVAHFTRNGHVFWSDVPVRVLGTDAPLDVSPDEAVITFQQDPRLPGSGLRRTVCDRSGTACLYVPRGPLLDQARSRGMLARAEGSALPEASRVADLEVRPVEDVPWAPDATLQVTVRHAGRQAPWPALGTQADPAGVVRVVATWDGGMALGDLPRTLVPGDETVVNLRLPEVPRGTEVTVSLIVDGRPGTPFGGGTATVTL